MKRSKDDEKTTPNAFRWLFALVLSSLMSVGCSGDSPVDVDAGAGTDSSVDAIAPGLDAAGDVTPTCDGGSCVVPACSTGGVANPCTCGETLVSNGYCCHGTPQSGACPPAFYVSPTGNDADPGTSLTTPFKTLEKARDSARASKTTKTIYLLDGVFARTATLDLSGADKGESWLGYPGQTPILEGGSTTATGIQINGDDITVRWLTLRNFVTNSIFLGWGDARNAVLDSNTILNTLSSGWVQAAIYMCCGQHTGVKITHNRIDGANYIGIHAGSSATSAGSISNTTIAYNDVHHTCRTVDDCGAIYVWEVEHTSTNILVDHNVVGDYGTKSNGSRALYLDDNSSNVTLKNNIAYGPGQWTVQFHGGAHNEFTNNVFDISGVGETLALYQHTGDKTPPDMMVGNSFHCNIVYSNATPPSSLWNASQDKPIKPPSVFDNVYWGKSGALPNTSPFIDTSPKVVNPEFLDPANANYAFSGANPAAFCGFNPIDVSKVGPLPNL